MRHAFVTGCAGFIGHHLVANLLDEGWFVTGIDNLSTGRAEDIEQYIGRPGFTFFKDDLLTAPLEKMMAGCDVVWHLGGNTLIPPGYANPRLDLDNNTIATYRVLEAMRLTKVPTIVFSSTAAVYGDGAANRVPLTEKHGPLYPISLYGASKLAAEAYVSAYSHLFGIRAIIFRFANVIGDSMGHGVIFDLVQKLKANPKCLEIWGDGRGEKPFFLVSDCVWGMRIAELHAEGPCEVCNLGTETYTTIRRVAEIVIEEMGLADVELKFSGTKRGFNGDVPIVRYTAHRMNSYGWKASHTSDEAVRIAARRIIDGTR
jgi:UDP-glucose 4-epimerase